MNSKISSTLPAKQITFAFGWNNGTLPLRQSFTALLIWAGKAFFSAAFATMDETTAAKSKAYRQNFKFTGFASKAIIP